MKTSTNSNTTTPGFRVIFRGKDKAGTTKRAVRTIHAPSFDAVNGYLAENGEKMAKSVSFKVDFVNVFVPLA